VKLTRHSDTVDVEIGSKPFTTYSFDPVISKAFLQPLRDANGTIVTRTLAVGNEVPPGHDGDQFPQQVFRDALYHIYFWFLETDNKYFDYAPALVPPQGRRRISGIDLLDDILRKVYYRNAARLLNGTV
jgi:hypothetical protein